MTTFPLLIAVEGIDGVGKSTQIPRLCEWLRERGIEAIQTAEPTREQYGREIRTATTRLPPARERELFVLDRHEHLQTCILPALQKGQTVITDRYFYSSIAYQGSRRDAFDHDPSPQELETYQAEIAKENRSFAPEADILLFLRLSPDMAIERMMSGRESLDPFEARQTLIDVANAFERIVATHPRAHIIDAAKSPDDVTREIQQKLEFLFLL